MDRTPYQEKIIKRYYENRDSIMIQKLSDMVGELYLSDGKKRENLWKRVATALGNLKVPDYQIENLVQQDKPELLARFLETQI